MSEKVYFTDLRARSRNTGRPAKVRKLFDAAGFSSLIEKRDLTAVKLHFGERGGDAFIHPIFVRQIVEGVIGSGGKPFLTDSNTLYSGSRHNAVDHLVNAIEHGFDYSVVRAPLIIADGLRSTDVKWTEINGKHFGRVRISSGIAIGCMACVEVCPVDAHVVEGGKVRIDKERCIGCGECLVVCRQEAIDLDWSSEIVPFQERMAEYALGCASNFDGRVGYMNFVIRVSPECDCFSWSDYPIVPDVGILASRDPVALDRACYDLVNAQKGFENSALRGAFEPGEDKFRSMKPEMDPLYTLRYAEELGLGSMDYEMITV
ncbi:4Fe-4S ferredoxin [Thermoplasmatales archaeon ex4484_6]|nr:MAG: 4Fe-4S ferredoxin [Thermoplasmatales archaeon ex4484_6]